MNPGASAPTRRRLIPRWGGVALGSVLATTMKRVRVLGWEPL